MRHVYIIAYDICLPERYRPVHRLMKGHGDRMQYSVFRCELTDLELHLLKEAIWPHLNLSEDRIMIVNVGPINGRGDEKIEFWGEPCEITIPRGPIVV